MVCSICPVTEAMVVSDETSLMQQTTQPATQDTTHTHTSTPDHEDDTPLHNNHYNNDDNDHNNNDNNDDGNYDAVCAAMVGAFAAQGEEVPATVTDSDHDSTHVQHQSGDQQSMVASGVDSAVALRGSKV